MPINVALPKISICMRRQEMSLKEHYLRKLSNYGTTQIADGAEIGIPFFHLLHNVQ